MQSTALNAAISFLRDAPTAPKMWLEALPLVINALNGVGGACFSRNDHTGAIEWAEIVGPVSVRRVDYVEHFAPLDPYLPALITAGQPGWMALSTSLPEGVLRASEWYQDFLRPSGVGDVLGIQLHQAGPSRIFFGIHYEKEREAPSAEDARLSQVLGHLQEAARLGEAQRMLGLLASLGKWAIGHLGDALFVAADTGRLIEMNAAAEQILAGGRALEIRQGRLAAVDSNDAERLAALIAAEPSTGVRRMLVGRADHQHCQLVTVFPLEAEWAPDERAVVLIRAVDLLARPASGAGVADLFGLSPAEARLAQALLQGKTLRELTKEFSVQMPTLRAQIRSVLRKCGVQRQVDLMRVLLRVQ